ncbi:MAG: TIR domain-containing protein [Pseudomonadota bacterium]|nr:TIR domain-containing protein [Pseudomonadota bacterium]
MGFCNDGDDHYDVFLSYSHDDDSRHNQWVSDFERYLKDKIVSQLRSTANAFRDQASAFRVCRDKTGFPVSGVLEAAIDEKVRHSHFLIIFLGRGYLNSTWCLSELDIFRDTAGATFQDAKERLYLIVLDSDAVEKLQEGDEPEHLPERRHKLWRDLQSLAQQVIRVEDFLRDDRLVPVYRDQDQDQDKADSYFHERCTPLVEELAKKLVACRSQRIGAPPSIVSRHLFAIGAVPPHLEVARDALKGALVEALGKTKVVIIEAADLGDRDKVRGMLKGVSTLVLPFDGYAPVVERGDPPGGHLGIQLQLLQESRGVADSPDLPLIWWQPSDAGATAGDPIKDFDRVFIDELPEKKTRRCGVREMATELAGEAKLGTASEHTNRMVARVLVEWEETDQDTIDEATDIVRTRFDKYCAEQAEEDRALNARLKFGEADWEVLAGQMNNDSGDKPLGVIIVYNENKDIKAFLEQERTISNLDSVLLKNTFPGLFYMRKKGMYKPTDDWSVVRFRSMDHHLDYKKEEVEEFVRHLFEILWKQQRLSSRGA